MQDIRIQARDKVKILAVGLLAGLNATLVVSGLIFAGEALMNYPHGLFYLIIGYSLGFDGSNALGMGMVMHIVTGVLIGLVASIPVVTVERLFRALSNFNTAMIYGIIVGVLVWLLFFLPVYYLIVMPTLEGYNGVAYDRSGRILTDLNLSFARVIYYSIGLHIQFGIVYSIITGAFIERMMKILSLEK
ncbi:hypothetical protein HRbin05_00383 [archaeon HR05]|nr:hypothetical protein HRbin05_00383 [archaeon HR05]